MHVLQVVQDYNANPDVHGILVQLPLPKHIDEQKVLNAISIEKDVDGACVGGGGESSSIAAGAAVMQHIMLQQSSAHCCSGLCSLGSGALPGCRCQAKSQHCAAWTRPSLGHRQPCWQLVSLTLRLPLPRSPCRLPPAEHWRAGHARPRPAVCALHPQGLHRAAQADGRADLRQAGGSGGAQQHRRWVRRSAGVVARRGQTAWHGWACLSCQKTKFPA